MRIKIIILLTIFIFIQRVEATESNDNKITRVAIASSDRVKYESKWLDNPPRLIVKFNTQNVLGQLIKDTQINQGVIKNITVNYYPFILNDANRKRIKFLTFWLNEKAPYKVWDNGTKIFIDFKNPTLNPEYKEIEISSSIDVKDIGLKDEAINLLLSKFGDTAQGPAIPKPMASKASKTDILWVLAVLLAGVYIMYFRPKEFRNFIDRLINPRKPDYCSFERRRWWRHNLLPLKHKNIYIKVNVPESNTKLGLMPRDIGYGGLSFECNRAKKLKGKMNIRIFLPGNLSPIETEGRVAWQKNSSNIFRRLVGISFINPPNKDWAQINNYIEEQYATLS